MARVHEVTFDDYPILESHLHVVTLFQHRSRDSGQGVRGQARELAYVERVINHVGNDQTLASLTESRDPSNCVDVGGVRRRRREAMQATRLTDTAVSLGRPKSCSILLSSASVVAAEACCDSDVVGRATSPFCRNTRSRRESFLRYRGTQDLGFHPSVLVLFLGYIKDNIRVESHRIYKCWFV
jgi:hypothetical protein